MSTTEKDQLEREFKRFMAIHFEKPAKCKNLGQIQYYIQEISQRVMQLKQRYNYVPDIAIELLSEYNRTQNAIIFKAFQRHYKPLY